MSPRNPWRGLQGLPRELWTLCIATFINRSGMMVLPFLVLYLTQGLGISARHAGAALTVYGCGSLLTAPISGRLSDRLGAPRILRASLFLSAACLLGLSFARRYAVILGVAFVWAVVNEAFRPASLATVGGLVPPEKRKAAFALNRLAINLGMSFGPALGGFLATVSFRWLFVVDAATSILAGTLLVLAPWHHDARAHAAADPTAPARPSRAWHWTALKDPVFLFFLAGMFPISVVFFQTLGAMPLFLVRDLHLPTWGYGLVFTINTVIILIVEVPLNHVTAHWSHRRALALGAWLAGAGFGALYFARDVHWLVATVVVWTFGEMILFPGSSAYVSDIAPPALRGEYMGFYSMITSASLVLGPWLGTLVLEGWGPRPLWAGAFVLGCLATVLLGRVRVPVVAAEAQAPAQVGGS